MHDRLIAQVDSAIIEDCRANHNAARFICTPHHNYWSGPKPNSIYRFTIHLELRQLFAGKRIFIRRVVQ